ncbi:AP-1 complex subunit beta-1 [Capsicum baccatum]|uniref:AP-1 complex subunit beta-1 n=1 Tax=Capsicum baccatum TaxID=33114 RepID=A0A2G2VMH5_CAPBA|nr:AP-1 complex subunit beta-1 [Capsicum baccatum]
MTLGKDVSSLFTDVVNCMQTENLELKELVYLYLIYYAKSQPDLAILVVNTFVKDSQDPNPLIRDLAVRTMGCIHVDKITEYLYDPLQCCLKDDDPYICKTIAICVAKIYDINADLAEDRGFLDALKDLISDNNPMVVANVVASLTEMQESSSRPISEITSHTLSKLLTALNKCAKLTCQVHANKLDPTLLDELFSNIATLSSVYNKPPKEFITRVKTTQKIEEKEYVDAGEQGYPDSPVPIAENDVLSPAITANAQHPAARQPSTPTALAFPDLLNLGMDNSNCAIVSTNQHATPADPPLPVVLLASTGKFQLFITGKELWGYINGVDPASTDPTKLGEWNIKDARGDDMAFRDYYSGFQNLWDEFTDIVYAKIPCESLSVIQQVPE